MFLLSLKKPITNENRRGLGPALQLAAKFFECLAPKEGDIYLSYQSYGIVPCERLKTVFLPFRIMERQDEILSLEV